MTGRAQPRVSVVVPWRGGCPHRARAWEHVRRWWADTHPRWQVVVGGCPDGPWRKGLAVAVGAARADADVIVVADADVICEAVDAAVQAVAGGAWWAIPHGPVYRLSPAATRAVLDGGDLPEAVVVAPRRHLGGQLVGVHRGMPGGGVTVLPAGTLRRVPIDPRFAGWGQEDTAWARALAVMAGVPWRGQAALWHLWHPPAPRQSRAVGSDEGLALLRRYRSAHTPTAMATLLDEIPRGLTTS